MPSYQVTAPDGRKYRVTAPKGATQEQALQYAQQNYQTVQQGSGGQSLLAQHKASSPAYAGLSDEDFGQRVYQKYYAGRMPYDEFQRRAQAPQQGPKPWKLVASSPEYQALPPDQQEAARQQYFAEVVAPQIGDPAQVQQARVQFDAQTKVDRAGDTEAAAAKGAPARANFGNVRSNATTVPGRRDTYTGPLLAPSTMAGAAAQAPTLADTNASNRAYQASPQAAIDRQRYAASQAEAKRRDFQSLPAPMRAAIGAGSRVAAAGRGVGQAYAAMADAISPRQSQLGDLVAGNDPSRYGQSMRDEATARADQQYMQGDTAATIGGFAGDLGLLAAPGGAVGRTRGLAALLGNAGLSAGYAGLQPVVQGESRATNAAVGGAFGVAGHGLGAGVSALGRNASQAIPSEVRQMARRANTMGIPLHASQVSQSPPVKVAASAGKYLPFSGYAKAASHQQEGINRAVAKTFGADAPKLTDDVMQQARQRLSRQFESIYNRNAVPITERGARKLAEVEREASRRLTNDEAQVLRNQLDDILGNADDGVLTGQKYQAVRTALRKAEGNDKLGLAVRELRQALDDIAADAVGPTDSAALKALRSQWANFRTVESALKQVSGAGGDVRLASLWPLIRKGSTKEMRDLARMGQVLLKNPIADSGTAQRTFAYNLLMGGGSIANPALIPLIAKAAIGGATVGRAANSNTLARLLARPNRGKTTTGLGALMQYGTPYGAPAAAVQYNNGGGR